MAPPPWATPEQTAFLQNEDETKWRIVKSGPGTLKGFYARTTQAFLEKWPIEPDQKLLDEVNGDVAAAKEWAEKQLLKVRPTTYTILTPPNFSLTAHRGLV